MPKVLGPNATDRYVGQRIRGARLLANMSQEKLSHICGLTFQQIQKYEKGTNRVSASRLVQISQAVNKPPEYFFDGAPGVNGMPSDATIDPFTALGATRCGIELALAFVDLPSDVQFGIVSMVQRFKEALLEMKASRASRRPRSPPVSPPAAAGGLPSSEEDD